METFLLTGLRGTPTIQRNGDIQQPTSTTISVHTRLSKMQVGDLVKQHKNDFVGVITEVISMNPSMERIYEVSWANGGSYHCLAEDIKVINASR